MHQFHKLAGYVVFSCICLDQWLTVLSISNVLLETAHIFHQVWKHSYVLYLLPLSTFSLDPHPFPGTAISSLPLSSLKVNRALIQWVATAESCPSPSQSITRDSRQGTNSEQELLIVLWPFTSSTKVKLMNFCTHRFFAQFFKGLDFIPKGFQDSASQPVYPLLCWQLFFPHLCIQSRS